MASKFSKESFKADKLLLINLYKKAGYKDSDLPILIRAVKHGHLAMESIFETAVSRIGKLKRVDLPGMDHDDGSDCKKVTAVNQGTKENPVHGAWFSVKNKKGVIRAIVVEPKTKIVYYFKFPPDYYLNKNENCKKKCIRIPFALDGSIPNLDRSNAHSARKIWSYQVPFFKSLCE